MTIKPLFLFVLAACLTTGALGQDQTPNDMGPKRQERMEKIHQAKIAFLTDKLNLSTDQAQKFWPVYNQYETDRRAAHDQARMTKQTNLETVTDQQVRENINQMYASRQNELNIEKQYVDKFLKVISVKQLATLYRSEREFTRVLLKKLDDRRPEGYGRR